MKDSHTSHGGASAQSTIRDHFTTILLVIVLVVCGVIMARSEPAKTPQFDWGQFVEGNSAMGDALGEIVIEQAIMDTTAIVRRIDKWRTDDSIKGLLVRINSPGGAVQPSQAVYDALMRVRAAQKPVIAVVESLGASGGYYIASGADMIVASRGSLVGSIGVIMQTMNIRKLADKVGIEAQTIKTGAFKDTGNPFRGMTTAETEYLQAVADETFEQFIADILAGRPQMDEQQLRSIADGRIFTGQSAYDIGLIDSLGGYSVALTEAAMRAGLDPEDPQIRRRDRRWDRWEDIISQLERGELSFWGGIQHLLFSARDGGGQATLAALNQDPFGHPQVQQQPVLLMWRGPVQ